MQLNKVAHFNPPEKLSKGTVAKKIPMAQLKEFRRKVSGYELAEYSAGPKFKNHDTLVAKITPCLENGKTAYVDLLDDDEIAFGSSEFIVLRAKEKTDPEFLYYLSISPTFRARAISCMEGTSGRKRVNEGVLKFHELPIPTKNEQQKIAAVLTSLDKKIELNNRINAELEAMAKTLYDYWFVQFDFPDANGKPYKTSGGKMVYNKTLKREIPEGWEVNVLGEWIKADKTGDWGKEAVEGNYTLQVECVRGADLNGLNGIGEATPPNRFILMKNAHKLLNEYDFVIEISGGSPTQSTGRIAHITKEVLDRFQYPLICSNFCKAITLKDNSFFYWFSYLWDSLYTNGVLFGWEGKTSGIKNLLFDSFVKNHPVASPPKELAKKFFNIAESLDVKKQTLLKENEQLVELRDWLLPMLMNGQVTVA